MPRPHARQPRYAFVLRPAFRWCHFPAARWLFHFLPHFRFDFSLLVYWLFICFVDVASFFSFFSFSLLLIFVFHLFFISFSCFRDIFSFDFWGYFALLPFLCLIDYFSLLILIALCAYLWMLRVDKITRFLIRDFAITFHCYAALFFLPPVLARWFFSADSRRHIEACFLSA